MNGRMGLGSILLAVWLIIGAFAAGQRGDYHQGPRNCSGAWTIAATVAVGPLNYVGLNPKIHCTAPQPSH